MSYDILFFNISFIACVSLSIVAHKNGDPAIVIKGCSMIYCIFNISFITCVSLSVVAYKYGDPSILIKG